MSNPTAPTWLTRQGVAEYLGVCLQTVDNLTAKGRLRKHSIGRIVRFNRDEVDAAMMGGQA